MKNYSKMMTTAAAAAAAIVLVSCGQTSEDARISFNTYSASSTYSLIGSAGDYNQATDVICTDSVSLVLPITLETAKTQPLRDIILETALGEKATSVEKAMHSWLDAQAKAMADGNYPTATLPSSEAVNAIGGTTVSGFVVDLDSQKLVYCVTNTSMIAAGANSMTTRRYINFILADGGKVLTLADLFTPAGLAQLPAMINEQAKTNTVYADNDVTITELPDDKGFYLSSEGEIVFSYDPMEVGPHSLGTIEVGFVPAQLVNLMTPEAIKLFGLTDLVDN